MTECRPPPGTPDGWPPPVCPEVAERQRAWADGMPADIKAAIARYKAALTALATPPQETNDAAEDVPDELVWAAEAAQAKVPLGPGCEGRLLRAALAAWNRRVPTEPSEQEMDAAQREQDRNGELWAILFHDTDMPPHVFHGEGAEECARLKYHAVRSTYNCVLMCPATICRAPTSDARRAAEDMRERAAAILDAMVVDLNKGRLMPAPTSYPDTVRGAFAAAIRALPLPGGGRDGVA